MSGADQRYTYGCCVHCLEDDVHDVEENWHVIACNSVRRPEVCEEGWRRFDRSEDW